MSAVALPRWENIYVHQGDRLRVHGRRTTSSPVFRRYVQHTVRERLRRASSREQLREYIEELGSTGFSLDSLTLVASEPPAPPRAWEIGEVLAEVLLEETEQAHFPWPPSWDKRTTTASLPGPDLIGFLHQEGEDGFVFGEVKTSDAEDVHNSVIYGDDGLRGQITALLAQEFRRQTLIEWLCVRARNAPWKSRFDGCLARYVGTPSVGLVAGVLIRGREPDEADLAPVRTAVEGLTERHPVMLLAFYLPVGSAELPTALEGSEELP